MNFTRLLGVTIGICSVLIAIEARGATVTYTNNDAHIIVGDQVTIGFTIVEQYDYGTTPQVSEMYEFGSPGFANNINGLNGYFTFTATHEGDFSDTLNLMLFYYPVTRDYARAIAHVHVTTDSVRRVWPYFISCDLFPNDTTKEWRGSFSPTLFNTVPDSSLFSNFQISGGRDTPLVAAYSSQGIPVSSIKVGPFQKTANLLVSLSKLVNSVYADLYDTVVFSCRVRSGTLDTILHSTIAMHFFRPQWDPGLRSVPNVLTFRSHPGERSSQVLTIYHPHGHLFVQHSLAAGWIRFDQSLQGDTISQFTLSTFADRGSKINDFVAFYFTSIDYLGKPRTDSIFVEVRLESMDTIPLTSWEKINYLDGRSRVKLCVGTHNHICMLTPDSVYHLSTDDGLTWITQRVPGGKAKAFADLPAGDRYILNTDSTLYRSLDNGITWIGMNETIYYRHPWPPYYFSLGQPQKDIVDRLWQSGDNSILLGSHIYFHYDLYSGTLENEIWSVSTSTNWMQTSQSNHNSIYGFFEGSTVDSNNYVVFPSPFIPNDVITDFQIRSAGEYEGTLENGLTHSTPDSATAKFNYGDVRTIALIQNGDIFVSDGSNRLYHWLNARNTWTVDNSGIPIGAHITQVVASHSGRVFVQSDSGVYRSTLPIWNGIRLHVNDEKIVNIYPNPASTVLHIIAPAGQNLQSMTIYDAIGNKIQSYQSMKNSPVATIEFKPDLPSGQYFLQMDFDGRVINRPFIVIH